MNDVLDEIMFKMNDINYGFSLNGKNIYPQSDEEWYNDFSKLYHLQSPEELMKTKLGVCWDQVELERYYLEKENIKCFSYFIVEYDGVEFPTHTFIIITLNNKYYWFEHSWEKYRGIHEYDTEKDLMNDVKKKFISSNKKINESETVIYKYNKPEYGISSSEFFKYCENGVRVTI